jgi:RNase P subunit RPR2
MNKDICPICNNKLVFESESRVDIEGNEVVKTQAVCVRCGFKSPIKEIIHGS